MRAIRRLLVFTMVLSPLIGLWSAPDDPAQASCRVTANATYAVGVTIVEDPCTINGGIPTESVALQSGENQGVSQATSWIAVRPLPFSAYTATNAFTPPATPTDLVTITGSATKTVKVWSVRLTTTNTAAGSQELLLIKRSSVDTTGTAVAGTVFSYDSGDTAGTATVNHYTANPGGLGTAVGTINRVRIASPAAVPASFAGIVTDAGYELIPKIPNSLFTRPIVLRGIAEQLAINFNGAALVAGQTHVYTIVWSEE